MSNSPRKDYDSSDKAFEYFFKEYYRILIFFARKLIADQLAAEDIVADIFLKFWQKQGDFKTEDNVKAFLFISTRNACLNHKERGQYIVRSTKLLKERFNCYEDFALNEIIRTEVLRQVWWLVEHLPKQCRKIILLSFVGGLTNQQIARKLNLSINTVRNQKVRGIELMRTRFREMENNINNFEGKSPFA